jgi:F-type H+-transporting ATPase subunit delta
MLIPGHWAKAFTNSLEKESGDLEEGLDVLKVLASWASSLPGELSGRTVEKKKKKLISSGINQLGFFSPAQKTAVQFFILMVRKNAIHHINAVIDASKMLLDKKRGLITVSMEYAFPPGEDNESRIIEMIKKRTGAARVDITRQVNPELLGGYRLRIGDVIIDASIRSQLRKLEACLASGIYNGDTALSRNGGN